MIKHLTTNIITINTTPIMLADKIIETFVIVVLL